MKSQNKTKTKSSQKGSGFRDFSPKGRVWARSKRSDISECIFELLQIKDPDPKCELFYKTPFQLLVSVVLSAQTTDKMVNQVMTPIYQQGFTPDTAIALGADGILDKIRKIGLAPTKSKNVFKLSQIIRDKYANQVPNQREQLESLPGVGRKTANVILGEIFGEPTIAVDTHVFRVGARLGLHRERTPEKAELELLKVIKPERLPAGHHHLILLGRYVCKAQKPACEACAVQQHCRTFQSNQANS